MPTGKVKWFNSKKVMDLLPKMVLRRTFFYMCQPWKSPN